MGELVLARRVARRIDPAVGGSQPVVHRQPRLVALDPRGFEPEIVDVRAPARGDQQVDGGKRLGLAVFLDFHLDAGFGRRDPGDPHPFAQGDALVAEPRGDDPRELRIVLAERREHLQHRNLGPEAAVRLGEFEPDRAAADHDQRRRQDGAVEYGLVGEVGDVLQPRDRRRRRPRSRGDDEAPRLDLVLARRHRPGAREATVLLDHRHAERLEALHRIVRGDRGDHAVDVVVHRGEIDLRRAEADAELARAPCGFDRPRGRDQRLRRDAADIEAIAAHPVALDQHHRGAHLGGAGGDAEPAGTGADHAEIDAVLLHRFAPRRAWIRL